MRRLAALLVVSLAVIAPECVETTGPEHELRAALEAARARWEAQGFTDYALVLRHLCFCPEEYVGPVVVNVRFGEIVSRVYQTSGQPVAADAARFFPDVEGLFVFIEDALDQQAASIRAEFHPEFGYPTEIFVDLLANAVDEESGYNVLSLDVLR